MPCLEHINEEDVTVFDLRRRVSSEINSFAILFDCVDISSQDMFKALTPDAFSSAQTCSPLLERHINDAAFEFFVYSSKAHRKLFILLLSN